MLFFFCWVLFYFQVGVHLRHYNEFRTRCPKCGVDFCSGCAVTPYHAGYTCQQLVEFKSASHCRFCNSALPAKQRSDVCQSAECAEKARGACKKTLACGHSCGGCFGESVCPPCLHEACDKPESTVRGQRHGNVCIKAAAGARLRFLLDLLGGRSAGRAVSHAGLWPHVSSRMCAQKIEGKWPGLRITFGYMDCPLCKRETIVCLFFRKFLTLFSLSGKVRMHHPLLAELMKPHEDLFLKLRKNAINRLKVDGMLQDERLITPGSPYFRNEELYALHSFAYYNCFKCKEAYFGGRRNCEQNQVENRDPSEMVCFDCGDVPKVDCSQPKAHAEFHEWKCRFCCSIAIWFCWGNTHFCEPCHQKAYEVKDKKPHELPKVFLFLSPSSFFTPCFVSQCPGKEQCPLRCDHPANGTEFSLGCGVCNNDAQSRKGGSKIGKDKDEGEPQEPQGTVAVAVAFVGGAVKMAKNAVRRSSRNK